jgi:NAD+ synthase (glutamine-hydrolysing)
MHSGDQFFNFYNHDFVRVAVAVPNVHVADPAFNANQTVTLMLEAAQRRVVLVLFPELGLSAYSCEIFFIRERCSIRAWSRYVTLSRLREIAPC